MSFRRLLTTIATLAGIAGIGAVTWLVITRPPATYDSPIPGPTPSPGSTPAPSGGGATLSAIASFVSANGVLIAGVIAALVAVVGIVSLLRRLAARRTAARAALIAFPGVDDGTADNVDDILRGWEAASAPASGRRGLRLGLPRFLRRSKPAEDLSTFDPFASVSVAAPSAPAGDPYADAFAPTFDPARIEPMPERLGPPIATPRPTRGRHPLRVLLAALFFLAAMGGATVGAPLALLRAAGTPLPGSLDALLPALTAAIAALGLEERLFPIAAVGATAALVLLGGIAAAIAGLLAGSPRRAALPPAPAAPVVDPSAAVETAIVTDPSRAFRPSDPATTPASAGVDYAAAAEDDFDALFAEAVAHSPAPSAPQPDSTGGPARGEGGGVPASAWGQAASGTSATGPAAPSGAAGPSTATPIAAPESAFADLSEKAVISRSRHRIEIAIAMIGGTLTGILLLQLFNSADPAAVFAPVITLIATYIDPGILSTVITAGGGALAALFVVGVVRMLRRGRRAAAAVPAAASRGTRLAGVAAAWVLFGAVAAVAAAVAIGGWPVDPTAAAAGLGRVIDAVASANALLRIGVIIGAAVAALLLSGAVVASFAAAAAAPSSDRRRSPAGPVLFAVLMVVGLVVGIAGARQMGLSIAAEPAATPSPSVTAEPSPSPSGSPATTPDPTVTLPGWVAIAPPGERFQARFPAAPTAGSVDSASAAGAVTSRTWTATADGATWMVIVSPYPNGVLDPTRSTEIIDGAISGAATRVSGTADTPTTVTSGALRGRETTIRTAAMTLRVRVYLVGTELWQATVGYARDAAAPDGVADFMAAIAAVDGATASPAPSGSPSGAGQLPVIGSTRPLPGSTEAARERLAGIEAAFDPTPAVSAAADEPLDQGPVLHGRATFYDASRNHAWYTHSTPGSAYYNQDGAPYYTFYAAASPRLRAVAPFRWGGQPYAVSITNTANGRVITAFVVDECACVGGGVIDLAPAAWAALAGPGVPFSRGVLDVRVEILYGAEA